MLNQFPQDKYLLEKASIMYQIEREKGNTIDISGLVKNKTILIKVEVDHKDTDGYTPLHMATFEGEEGLQTCYNILASRFCNPSIINATTNNHR